MNILIILANPDPKSFCYAIAEKINDKLKAKHSLLFHDLYHEKFNPVLYKEEIPKNAIIRESLVNQHCQDLKNADGIIIIHPNWWGQPPAILTGWVDRVMRAGLAYEFKEGDNGEGIPVGLLKAKTAIVFNTSNTSEERELNIFKDPLETIWKNCIFDFCGIKNFRRKMFRIVITSSESQRTAWLKEVEDIIEKI